MYGILYEENIILKSIISLFFIVVTIAFSIIVSEKKNLKDKFGITNLTDIIFFNFCLYVFLIIVL